MSFSTGLIHETCSCSAEISAPATALGRETVAEWRSGHRHDKPRPEMKSLRSPNLPSPPYRPETDLSWPVKS